MSPAEIKSANPEEITSLIDGVSDDTESLLVLDEFFSLLNQLVSLHDLEADMHSLMQIKGEDTIHQEIHEALEEWPSSDQDSQLLNHQIDLITQLAQAKRYSDATQYLDQIQAHLTQVLEPHPWFPI